MVPLTQPLSIIEALPPQITIYAEKRHGSFTNQLAPSIPEEQIEALQQFKQYVEGRPKIKTIGFYPRYLSE